MKVRALQIRLATLQIQLAPLQIRLATLQIWLANRIVITQPYTHKIYTLYSSNGYFM